MKVIKIIGAWLLKRTRIMFMKRKDFFGSYADNDIQVRKYIADRNILALHWQNDALSLTLSVPKETASDPGVLVLIQEQVRAQRREFRKKKRSTLIYTEDHVLTRLLGFRETKIHQVLSQ